MNNIAIIPARCGSKGLKDKNIKHLNGIPLIGYSIRSAKESNVFNEIMVSTDSQLYAEIAKNYGATVPFLRSKENSGDLSGSWDVVKEVLGNYYSAGKMFDTVCLLQPTSPLRNKEDIIAGYKELAAKNADAITSVCAMEHSPQWAMTLEPDGFLGEFRKRFEEKRRQDIAQYYRINGAIYIRKIQYEGKSINILNDREYAYIMDTQRSVDIDTEDDFEYAEWIIKKNCWDISGVCD